MNICSFAGKLAFEKIWVFDWIIIVINLSLFFFGPFQTMNGHYDYDLCSLNGRFSRLSLSVFVCVCCVCGGGGKIIYLVQKILSNINWDVNFLLVVFLWNTIPVVSYKQESKNSHPSKQEIESILNLASLFSKYLRKFSISTRTLTWKAETEFNAYYFPCSGDTDSVVPVTATRFSLGHLNLKIKTRWYPWYSGRQVMINVIKKPIAIPSIFIIKEGYKSCGSNCFW